MSSLSLRPKKSRPKICICTCRSYCTTYNSTTGSYEGSQTLTRGTRYNHRKDDELEAQKQATTAGSRNSIDKHLQPALVVERDRKAYAEWMELIEKEVVWYSSLPLTSQTSPLVFVNNPALHEDYLAGAENIRPNHGLYALKVGPHANSTFLAMENRFCELFSFISTDSPPDIGDHLTNHLREEIARMNHEKMLQWTEQRQKVHTRPGGTVLVNTGNVRPFIGLENKADDY